MYLDDGSFVSALMSLMGLFGIFFEALSGTLVISTSFALMMTVCDSMVVDSDANKDLRAPGKQSRKHLRSSNSRPPIGK